MNLSEKALKFAAKAHDKQYRKDGVTPYIVHPIQVRDTLLYFILTGKVTLSFDLVNDVLEAAILHDVVEDTDKTLDDIREEFGHNVADLVEELTNRSKLDNNVAKLNRAERKKVDRESLSHSSYEARVIKFVDRICNIQDDNLDKGFMLSKYLPETKALNNALLANIDSFSLIQIESLSFLSFLLHAHCLDVELSLSSIRVE